jgi:hydroxymethylbilane synthase
MTRTIKLGSRGSKLALIQTRLVRKELKRVAPDLDVEIVTRETSGDRFAEQSIHELPGKGFFTKDLDQAVISGEVDAAVHSAKDVPTDNVDGLTIGAFLPRESPGDVLVARPSFSGLDDLPERATVGTSSLRRQALLLHRRPDLEVEPIRGNVDTRLNKLLEQGLVDALVLAEAGLNRLERADVVTEKLDPRSFYPAPGQGAILVQCRDESSAVTEALAEVNDDTTDTQINTERTIIDELDGGCRIPLGAYCFNDSEQTFEAHGMVASLNGDPLLTASRRFHADDRLASAREIAEELREQGAVSLIDQARSYLQEKEQD